MAKRKTDDRVEETDETLAPEAEGGDKDELLVAASGRADIPGRLVEDDDDVGEYKGEDESLAPDYEYRVSTAVSDEYGEYPGPGDDDLPLGYTSDEKLAAEEGLSYYPPDDPATLPDEDAEQGLEVAAGFAASARDAGYDEEDMPARIDRSDDELAEDVLEALNGASLITGFHVGVRVRRGVAYIKGEVSTFDDLAILASVVQNVDGIEDVDDSELDVSENDIEGVRRAVSPQVPS